MAEWIPPNARHLFTAGKDTKLRQGGPSPRVWRVEHGTVGQLASRISEHGTGFLETGGECPGGGCQILLGWGEEYNSLYQQFLRDVDTVSCWRVSRFECVVFTVIKGIWTNREDIWSLVFLSDSCMMLGELFCLFFFWLSFLHGLRSSKWGLVFAVHLGSA